MLSMLHISSLAISLNLLMLFLIAESAFADDGMAPKQLNPEPSLYEQVHQIDALELSRDGSALFAIHTPPAGPAHIVRLSPDGGAPEEVFGPLSGQSGAMLLSPKGHQLAFTFDAIGNEMWKLQLLEMDSGRFQMVTPRGMLDMPCGYSPEGNAIFSARGAHIWEPRGIVRIDAATGDAKPVYEEIGAVLNCLGVSPDGGSLLLWRYISNEIRHLGLLDLDSGIAEWFSEEDSNTWGAFFHDGDVYFASTRGGRGGRAWRWVAGGEIEPFNLPIEGRLINFHINETGSLLVSWRESLGPRTALFRKTGGSTWTEIQLSENDTKLGAVTIPESADLPIVFSLEDGSPQVIYSRDGAGTHILLDTDASSLPDSAFAHYQSVLVESFDGLEIPTHILKPTQANRDNPLPMIVYVHGGPEEHVDATYSAARQAAVSAGFVAIMPNVRGSTGFGQAYADMDDGDWGGAHIRDLLAVADYAATLDYIADQPRFIMGGSFGGFSVLSIISQYPDTFDGAVDLFGISDIEKFVASLPQSVRGYFIKEIGFDPEDNPDRARTMSPLYAADRINTPLQIHQGIHDPRVSAEQSRAMVDELKKRGADVEYYEYDGGHGFAHQEDDLLSRTRMIEFFQRLATLAKKD